MAPQILTDDDLRARLTPERAVQAMLSTLTAHGRGELVAPPRVAADIGAGSLIFTAGATGTHYGFRSYDTRGGPESEQVVVAHDALTGAVAAIAVGNLLGPRRTGALGGAAASLLAGPGPHTVAVIGAGVQARNQLWALSGVLDVAEVRVHSLRAARRECLAEHAREVLEMPARACASAAEAVAEASLVVLATTASEPVVDVAWLRDDVLVHTLGAKTETGAEIPADLLTGAFVTADSPAQHLAEERPLLPAGGAEAVVPLGRIAAGLVDPPVTGRRVYLSCGLAGTEVALLAAAGAAGRE